MNIIPNRNMHLDGRRVEAGKLEEVSQSQGELAIKHGWAVSAGEIVDFAKCAQDAKSALIATEKPTTKPRARTGK